MSDAQNVHYEVLWVSEEELQNFVHDHRDLVGVPRYFSVSRQGSIMFWPKLDPEKFAVNVTPRWGK